MYYIKKWEKGCILGALVLLSLLTRFIYFFDLYRSEWGLPEAYDTKSYFDSVFWLVHHFSVRMHFNDILYLGYILVLTFLWVVLRSTAAIVVVQVLVGAASVVLVYEIGEILFNKRVAILSGIFYAISYPVIYWTIYILSDSFFVTLLLLSTYLLLRYLKEKRRLFLYGFWFSILYMAFFRPTGILSALFIVLYWLMYHDFDKVKRFLSGKKAYLIGAVVMIGVVIAVVVKGGIFTPLYNSIHYFSRWILLNIYANGQIFDQKNYYDYKYAPVLNREYFDSDVASFLINNWYHILGLYGKRIWMFWKFEIYPYPLYLLYRNMLYIFGIFGLIGFARQRVFKKASILIFVILSVKLFCILIFMDSAVRYRMPLYVFLGIISAYGVDYLLSQGANVWKRLSLLTIRK